MGCRWRASDNRTGNHYSPRSSAESAWSNDYNCTWAQSCQNRHNIDHRIAEDLGQWCPVLSYGYRVTMALALVTRLSMSLSMLSLGYDYLYHTMIHCWGVKLKVMNLDDFNINWNWWTGGSPSRLYKTSSFAFHSRTARSGFVTGYSHVELYVPQEERSYRHSIFPHAASRGAIHCSWDYFVNSSLRYEFRSCVFIELHTFMLAYPSTN